MFPVSNKLAVAINSMLSLFTIDPLLVPHFYIVLSMASSSKASASPSSHLTYPEPDESAAQLLAQVASSVRPQPKVQVKERLYVGNLHPTVDEYVSVPL